MRRTNRLFDIIKESSSTIYKASFSPNISKEHNLIPNSNLNLIFQLATLICRSATTNSLIIILSLELNNRIIGFSQPLFVIIPYIIILEVDTCSIVK